jgi:hypothetical protein
MPALTDLLSSARAALGAGAASGYSDAVRADVDLYLTLASSLLGGQQLAPTGFADPAVVTELYGLAVAGQAASTIQLFGMDRDVDWSQFVRDADLD